MTRSFILGLLLIFSSTILTVCTSYIIENARSSDSLEFPSDPHRFHEIPLHYLFGHHGQSNETTSPTETTTAAEINTTTENTLREEDVRALTLLNETTARIKATQFHLCKQKTELSLKSLNGVIPELETIQGSLRDLLISSAPGSGSAHPPVSFTEFKKRDDALENELSSVNERMDSDRRNIQKYSAAYAGVEDTLRVVQQTLEGILLPSLNSRNSSVEEINGSESVHSVPMLRVGKTEIPTTAPSFSPTGGNILHGCGGSFKSRRGSIVYKLNEDLNSNEGCIWIITTPQNISGVSLQIRESKLIQQNHLTYVAVGHLVDTQYGVSDEFHWRKLNSSNTAREFIPFSARVVFIQFLSSATTDETNSGFHLDFELQYSGPVSNTNLAVEEPEDTFLTGPSGTYKYPQNASAYSDNARAVIVIQPTLPNTSLYIKWYGIEARGHSTGNVYDSLNIWTFDHNPLIWQRKEQLAGTSNLNKQSPYAKKYRKDGTRNKNPFVLYFKSDGSATGPGFELFWNNSGN